MGLLAGFPQTPSVFASSERNDDGLTMEHNRITVGTDRLNIRCAPLLIHRQFVRLGSGKENRRSLLRLAYHGYVLTEGLLRRPQPRIFRREHSRIDLYRLLKPQSYCGHLGYINSVFIPSPKKTQGSGAARSGDKYP